MRSTLITTGMLQQDNDNTFITLCDLPEEHKNLQNVLAIIENFFTSTQTDGAKSFEELYNILTGTHDGIGMRKGLIPIYIAVVLRKYQKNVVIRNQFSEVGITPSLLNDINESPNDYSVKIEKWSDEKEAYIDMLDELFADYILEADKAKTGYSYLAIAMGRWYLSLPRYTKELKQVYTGYLEDESYSEVDGKKRKFMALLKQPSIGALDLLFSRIPKCFGKEEASVELAREIASAKMFFDQVKLKLEDALIMVLQGIVEPGMHIYISPFEHNAVTRTLHALEATKNVTVHILPYSVETGYDLAATRREFNVNKPNALVISHASNVCGLIAPVGELTALAKEFGCITILDMAQTAGLVPLNVGSDNVDYAVFAGHKTLYGPIGIGGFVKKPEAKPIPILFGGTGIESALQDMPHDAPARYEMGSQNIHAISGLHAALTWFLDNAEEIRTIEEKNHKRLLSILNAYSNITIVGSQRTESALSLKTDACTYAYGYWKEAHIVCARREVEVDTCEFG